MKRMALIGLACAVGASTSGCATIMAGGPDLFGYPRYYRPYAEVRGEVLKASAPFADLAKYNPKERVDAELAKLGRAPESVRFVPMRSGKRDLAVLVDARTGDYLGPIALKPWPY